ncbi:MAG: aminotransferase class V-fold PLP-dependent enzyme [Hamadaea sp.]|uniref:aminotransferase class V-fold PLP-dependent enzyme n=1 Tax=Hamadaea sp. TaxID=2024425 RepID=UPI001797633B|nr:aminotransferase class V-fold PLP-dependent enzyme [Hamadaea sp.]NUR70807.1 aminotransferase class V-fold PLP-dependent enzyme [Hamadaea sp.]NUT20160.1 aminotransferase class V-fold PLP-dependent enzyme [Hamadaea sp.]
MNFEGGRELFSFDPSVGYLNHGSFGAVAVPVRQTHRDLLDEVDRNPMRFARRLPGRLAEVRARLAGYVGADPTRSALVVNATTATATVLHTLAPLVRPEHEILTTDHAYDAVLTALDRFSRRTGVRVRIAHIPLAADDDEVLARLMAEVRPGVTQLAIVDHIAAATAKLFPIERIAAALRAERVPLLVDAAHVPGMLDTDVEAIGADFWTGNFHKWAFAPRGTALLTVGPEWVDRIEPLVVSHGDPEGFPWAIEHQGTRDVTAWLAAPAGLDLLASLGPDRVRAYAVRMAEYTQAVVADAVGADRPYPGDGVSMRVIPLTGPPGSAAAFWPELRARLGDELGVEVNVNPWEDGGLLRVSGHVYVTDADAQRLAAGLPGLLRGAAA